MRFSKDAWLFAAIPLGIEAVLLASFFMGPEWAAEVVAPMANREFGALENLQLALLAVTVVIAIRGALLPSTRFAKTVWAGLAAFSFVVLLEEIDYGLHYIEWFTGTPPEERAEVRNLHNNEGVLRVIKPLVDIGFALLYAIIPWFAAKFPAWIRRLLPNKWSAATLILAGATRLVAHWFDDRHPTGEHALHGNVSEFRELMTYWVATLHVATVFGRAAKECRGANVSEQVQG